MKKYLIIALIPFLFSTCRLIHQFNPCYQLEGMPDRLCTRMHTLIAGKTWWLDSVSLNGVDITADCLARAKDFRFEVGTVEGGPGSNEERNIYFSTITFNDTVFLSTCVEAKKLNPLTEPFFNIPISDGKIVSLKNRPLICGILPFGGLALDTNPDGRAKFHSVTDKQLVITSFSKDSILFNVFKMK